VQKTTLMLFLCLVHKMQPIATDGLMERSKGWVFI